MDKYYSLFLLRFKLKPGFQWSSYHYVSHIVGPGDVLYLKSGDVMIGVWIHCISLRPSAHPSAVGDILLSFQFQ